MTIQILIQTSLTFIPRLGVSYNRVADSDFGVPNGSTWMLSLVVRDPRSNHRLAFLGMPNL